MTRAPACAKLNLALVVGPRREDGKHEVTTVFQRIDLCDRIELEPAANLSVRGFAGDTLVTEALQRLAAVAGVRPRWRVTIRKRIPVAAGLGGGSSDAATALRLANATLDRPLSPVALLQLARELGADVPFFLRDGPQLGAGDGTSLSPIAVPQDFWVVVALPHRVAKRSTASVYEAFDRREGDDGYEARREQLLNTLAGADAVRTLAALPPNDLASSPLAGRLAAAGAVRADVTGAGPAVYGIFEDRSTAVAARASVDGRARAWVTVPAWYG